MPTLRQTKRAQRAAAALTVGVFIALFATLLAAQAASPVWTVIAFTAALACGVTLDWLSRTSDLSDSKPLARHVPLVVALVLLLITALMFSVSHETTSESDLESCRPWPYCEAQGGYCKHQCGKVNDTNSTTTTIPADELGQSVISLPSATLTITAANSVSAPDDDAITSLCNYGWIAVRAGDFMDSQHRRWLVTYTPNTVPADKVIDELADYCKQLSPSTTPVTPAAAGSECELGGCAGYPFCLLQHGYCAENCSDNAHVCDPYGCNVRLSALRQFVEEAGSIEAAAKAFADNNVTIGHVTDDTNDNNKLIGAAEDGCDNHFCAKNLGWPWCLVCSGE